MHRVHKHSLSNHLAHTWTHKLSLSQTDTVHSCLVSKGQSADGDYQVDEYNVMWRIQMPSLLFFDKMDGQDTMVLMESRGTWTTRPHRTLRTTRLHRTPRCTELHRKTTAEGRDSCFSQGGDEYAE